MYACNHILSIFLSFCIISCYDLKINQFIDYYIELNIKILILIIFEIISMFLMMKRSLLTFMYFYKINLGNI